MNYLSVALATNILLLIFSFQFGISYGCTYCPAGAVHEIRSDAQDKKAHQELGDNYQKALDGHYPPLKQWKEGIGITEIVCKQTVEQTYALMYNQWTFEPICVTPKTSNILVQSGTWLRVLADIPDYTIFNATQH